MMHKDNERIFYTMQRACSDDNITLYLRPWLVTYTIVYGCINASILVPGELQKILDEKFDFLNRNQPIDPQILVFAKLWLNLKTRKLAELMFL